MSCRKCALAAMLGCVAVAAGCHDQPVGRPTPPRPVKVEVVKARQEQSVISYVGTVLGVDRGVLGFETGGRVARVLVNIGDRVRVGQVLAMLDQEPLNAALVRARSARDAAAAEVEERARLLRESEQLLADRIVSRSAVDAVRAQLKVSATQLAAADAALKLASRDVSHSALKAPFDGQVTARLAHPQTVLAPGQPVLEIEGSNHLEVEVLLPSGFAAALRPEQQAQGTPVSDVQPNSDLKLAFVRTAAHSELASLRRAIFRVESAAPELRSGSLLRVALPTASGGDVLSLPATALLPDKRQDAASIFVLDTRQGRVVRRDVTLGQGLLPGGRVPINQGLAEGEAVVIAGAAFLTDGQAAAAHVATSSLQQRP